jgi:DNA-binding protein YbaB
VVDPDDVEMLEDLILAAFKEAMDKSQQAAAERLGPLTSGLDIPGLL